MNIARKQRLKGSGHGHFHIAFLVQLMFNLGVAKAQNSIFKIFRMH